VPNGPLFIFYLHQQFEPRPFQFERKAKPCIRQKTERAVSKVTNDFKGNSGNKVITGTVNINSARNPTAKSEEAAKKEEKENLETV